ncbi:hypothetical protein BC827DRAFT_552733 [Russula dissimulans]|nr:hypothetical protein BC827DRAFT_552733 [Russula dissimulans]
MMGCPRCASLNTTATKIETVRSELHSNARCEPLQHSNPGPGASLPDPDNHSLSVYGFSAPHLPSSRPAFPLAYRSSSRLTARNAPSTGFISLTRSFSFLTPPLTYLPCGSAVTRPNGAPCLSRPDPLIVCV